MKGISNYIVTPPASPAKPITLDEFREWLESLPWPHPHPRDQPLVLDEYERQEWEESGQVYIEWDDGTTSIVMSQERKEQYLEALQFAQEVTRPEAD